MADEIEFDWDEDNVNHLARHNVTSPEAEQAVLNGSIEIAYQIVEDEQRYVIVGRSNAGRFLTLVWTEREGAIRVITGWDATEAEEREYWKGV
ncbi:MAG TPA: BrnT family toxin [Bryobacteraceae bacterium]|nr:BrnT family toxin [Bryobacteraceae bacterium]